MLIVVKPESSEDESAFRRDGPVWDWLVDVPGSLAATEKGLLLQWLYNKYLNLSNSSKYTWADRRPVDERSHCSLQAVP